MTIEQAIYELETNVCYATENIRQACIMAVEALEQQKTGKWVKIAPYPMQTHEYACSECGHETHDNTENYCSECGAKMIDPQESEDD